MRTWALALMAVAASASPASAQNEQQKEAKVLLAEMRKQIPTTPMCALGASVLAYSSAAVVTALGPDAFASGIRVGDRIASVNERPVTRGADDVAWALKRNVPGDEIRLRVYRGDSLVDLTAECVDRRVQMQTSAAVFEAMAAGQWSHCFDRVDEVEALGGADSTTARMRLSCRFGQDEAEGPGHRFDSIDAGIVYEAARRLISDWRLAPEGADHVRAYALAVAAELQKNGFASFSDDLKTQLNAASSAPHTSTEGTMVWWWRSEYRSLLAKLATAPDHRLQTAYTNEENGQVKLELSQLENQSVLLVVDSPGESVWKYDETGHLVHGSGRMIFLITDSNRDGVPETFSNGPSRSDQSVPRPISVTEDGAILAAWGIGIGYCVNWFLHDHLDAAFPRKPNAHN